jgi:hypothetical protein
MKAVSANAAGFFQRHCSLYPLKNSIKKQALLSNSDDSVIGIASLRSLPDRRSIPERLSGIWAK